MFKETIPEVKIPWIYFCIKKCALMCPCMCQFPCLNVSTSHGPVILIIWISLLVWFQWTHNKLGPIKQMSKHRFTFSLVQANPPDDVMKISLHLSHQLFRCKDHLISRKCSVRFANGWFRRKIMGGWELHLVIISHKCRNTKTIKSWTLTGDKEEGPFKREATATEKRGKKIQRVLFWKSKSSLLQWWFLLCCQIKTLADLHSKI